MKKLISLFLAVVMVFSLTVPVLAAEPVVTGSTSGEVTANFNPEIAITDISFTGETVSYDADKKTYTAVIPAGLEAVEDVYLVFAGTNLNYIPANDETYLWKLSYVEEGESVTEVWPVGEDIESGYFTVDGERLVSEWGAYANEIGLTYDLSFSNDGGLSWSDLVYYVVKQAYAISVGTSGESGTVSVMDGKTSAVEGETVELIVDTGVGYELDELTVKYTDEEGNEQNVVVDEEHQFVMPAYPVTVTATFKAAAATYSVEISASEGGEVSIVDAKDAYHHNDDVTLNVTPVDGYELDSLTITYKDEKGVEQTLHYTNTYTFVMPAADVTVSATFKRVYKVNIDVNDYGSVTASKKTAAAGEEVILTITPDEGYALYSLYVNREKAIVTGNTYTFTMPEGSVDVVAVFERTGKALETLYVKNTGNWSTIKVYFYTDSGIYAIDSANLTIVPGESDIYHTTAIPEFAYKVAIMYSDGTNTEMIDLPTDGVLNQYNPDTNTWTTYVPTSQTTISADIAWGSMAFTYTDEGGWTNDGENGGEINVVNRGTPTFTAEVEYTAEDSYSEIVGTFNADSAELASGHYKVFILSLDGAPKKAIPAGTKIGTVTVTIK